jgi:hypothetical protein
MEGSSSSQVFSLKICRFLSSQDSSVTKVTTLSGLIWMKFLLVAARVKIFFRSAKRSYGSAAQSAFHLILVYNHVVFPRVKLPEGETDVFRLVSRLRMSRIITPSTHMPFWRTGTICTPGTWDDIVFILTRLRVGLPRNFC